jgi:hypothetical protein
VSARHTTAEPGAVRAGHWYQGPPLLVPGTVVACYLVSTGRWGSHLGWPQHSLYVTDIGLATTGLWTLARHRRGIHLEGRLVAVLALPVVAIAAWAAIRMIINGQFDAVALRDAAPFGYVMVALAGLVVVDQAARRRTLAALATALVLHAVWVTAALHLSLPTYYLSDGLLRIFEVRPDFDSAMLGVLCGLSTFEALRPRPWWRRLVASGLAVWPALVLLETGTRAGALGLLAALAITAAALVRNAKVTKVRLITCIGVVAGILAVVVPQTSLYARLTEDPTHSVNGAAGTTEARKEAWALVLEYVSESPTRVAFGVGPGPDFLAASGARPYFGQVHQTDIRVPHNVLLTYYARLGVIGVTLFLALLASWVWAGWQRVVAQRPDDLDLAQLLITATLLLASLVGVILESPFGAVPFYWALGQIVAACVRDREEESKRAVRRSEATPPSARSIS